MDMNLLHTEEIESKLHHLAMHGESNELYDFLNELPYTEYALNVLLDFVESYDGCFDVFEILFERYSNMLYGINPAQYIRLVKYSRKCFPEWYDKFEYQNYIDYDIEDIMP